MKIVKEANIKYREVTDRLMECCFFQFVSNWKLGHTRHAFKIINSAFLHVNKAGWKQIITLGLCSPAHKPKQATLYFHECH